MLYEIECDKFAETVDGVRVPRGRIRFREGLNTVLGDKLASNSIGKSTFLMALDFCFGGDDYLNREINNVVDFVGPHVINFAFRFGGRYEYYCRDTKNPGEVLVCDEDYKPDVSHEPFSIEEFRNHLREAYRIETAENSWRSLVGRYSRIYGRDNANERRPLKYGNETVALSIMALEELFGVYHMIKEYEDNYETRNIRQSVRDKGTEIGEIKTIARSQKQVRENEKEIAKLEEELSGLTNEEDESLAVQDTANLDRAAELKGRITVLRRKRTRLVSQLNAVKANLAGGFLPASEDLQELQEYFPGVSMEKLEKIENFHQKMQHILTGEMSDEISRLESLIQEATDELRKLEDEQRGLGIPTNISKKFLDRTVEIRSRLNLLKEQNEGYRESRKLKTETSEAKKQMELAREGQLEKIETQINQQMVLLNEFIFNGDQYAPEIHFTSTRTGKPNYTFKCESNIGAGENYKNLIIYDLSILEETELPFLMHDSMIFKNVADLPIDKIMKLYLKSRKQIFIAFDKQEAFTEFTTKTLYDTKRIELHENGGELFGWSWAKKKKDNAGTKSNAKAEKPE